MGVYNITKDLDDWNIDSPYSIGTIVSYDGKMYKALKDVPVGVNLGFNEYWKEFSDGCDIAELLADVDELQSDVAQIQQDMSAFAGLDDMEEVAEDVESEVSEIDDTLTTTVGDDTLKFRFKYDSTTQKYGFLDVNGDFQPFS